MQLEITKQERNSLICAIDSKLITLKSKLQEIPQYLIPNSKQVEEIKEEITNLNNLRKQII